MDSTGEVEGISALGVLDYIIIVITVLGSVAIGVYFRFSGGKQKTNEEYLLADRNMSILPVAVSVMASYMSAITLLGATAEFYYYGMLFVIINTSYGAATFIASRYYLPVFFNLQKTSTYEYLELRFGPTIRMLASLTYTLQMVLYNGIVLYAPALVIESVSGLDRVISIVVVGVSCVIYSTMGGMKAVLFTDLLQSLLMFLAVLSVLVHCSIQVGGFDQVFVYAQQGGRVDFSNIDPTERHTWWSVILGGLITYLSMNAVNHTQILRLQTVSTVERSQQCLWWSWPIFTIVGLTAGLSGLGIYAVYRDCDPLTSESISAIDQLMPYYVVNSMNHIPGLAGLFVAGIFSASLSTISSACNALAAVTLHDYIGRWFKISPSYMNWTTKIAAAVYGLLFLGLAFVAQHLGGLLQAALTIFGVVGGPLLGVFTLGMFTTYANERGVSISLLSGMAIVLWFSFGTPRPAATMLPLSTEGCAMNVTVPPEVVIDPSDYFYPYRISYMWTSPMGFIWVIIVGSIISLLWRQEQVWEKAGQSQPDPALFTPPLARRIQARYEKKSTLYETKL